MNTPDSSVNDNAGIQEEIYTRNLFIDDECDDGVGGSQRCESDVVEEENSYDRDFIVKSDEDDEEDDEEDDGEDDVDESSDGNNHGDEGADEAGNLVEKSNNTVMPLPSPQIRNRESEISDTAMPPNKRPRQK